MSIMQNTSCVHSNSVTSVINNVTSGLKNIIWLIISRQVLDVSAKQDDFSTRVIWALLSFSLRSVQHSFYHFRNKKVIFENKVAEHYK